MLILICVVIAGLGVFATSRMRARAATLQHRLETMRVQHERLAVRDAIRAAFTEQPRPMEACLHDSVDALVAVTGVDGAAIVRGRLVCARGAESDALDELRERAAVQRITPNVAAHMFADRERVIALTLERSGKDYGVLVLAGPGAVYQAPFVEEARRALTQGIVGHAHRCRSTGKSVNRRTTTVMATDELWRHRRSAARAQRARDARSSAA